MIHQVVAYRITFPQYVLLSPAFALFVFVVVPCMVTCVTPVIVSCVGPLCVHSFRTFFSFSAYHNRKWVE
jgi:hypothetical protein